MPTYRYNVIIDVDINASKAGSGKNAVIGDLSVLEREVNKISGMLDQHFNTISSAANKNSQQMGVWSQAFRGAFIGAIAGMTFSTIISGITGIVGKTEELIVSSVDLAAKLETSRNAMTFFTGSVSAGRDELDAMDKLARNTPGLRMLDAEAGATRLRALNFEMKTAQNLVVGIAKQKLISGVDDEGAVSRVLINLQQLRAGSPQIQRDIQQMVLALPSLSVAIDKTFGSIDKFKTALRTDSGAALDKFAKALADTEAPAGGLTDRIGKLEDAWISAGRAFGEPLLEPLTEGVTDLTAFLYQNQDTFTQWGNTAGDILRGIAALWRDASQAKSEYENSSPQARFGVFAAENAGIGLLRAGSTLIAPGAWEAADLLATRGQKERPDPRAFVGGRVNMQAIKAANAGQIADNISTRSATQGSELEILKNQHSMEERALDNHHRYTISQELAFQKQLFRTKQENRREDWQMQARHFDELLKLAGDDEKQSGKIWIARNKAYSQFQKEQFETAVEWQKKQSDMEAQMAEERRRTAMEANSLDFQALEQSVSARERAINREIDVTGTGYDKLIDLSYDQLTQMTKLIGEQTALQLQDQTLTADARVNIERNANLQIQAATEAHATRLAAIRQRQYQQIIAESQSFLSRFQAASGVDIGAMQNISKLFTNDVFFGAGVDELFGLNAVIGTPNADLIRNANRDVVGGSQSIYQAHAAVQQRLQEKDQRSLDVELREAKKVREAAEQTGTSLEVGNARANERLLALKKEIQLIDQGLENNALKMAEDLETINKWTEKIANGERDRVIQGLEQVRAAKEYQAAVVEARTQEVVLGNQDLVNQIRKTELLKTQTQLRNEELAAIISIDRSGMMMNRQLVYSQNRADAKVADFLASQKGITEIVSDAKINLMTNAYSALDNVIGRLTKNMGMFGDSIRSVLSDLLKLALNTVFRRMFGLGGGSGGGSGMPGFGGGVSPTPNFNPMAAGLPNVFNPIPGATGSVTNGMYNVNGNDMLGPGGYGGGMMGSGSGGGSGSMFSGLRGGLGAMLPFLGASLGGALGGESKLGMGMGMVGGAALGVMGMAALAPTAFASMAPAWMVGLLANPIGAAAVAFGGGALLIGAYLLARNKRRRMEETQRDAAMRDAFSSLDKLIADVNADRIDGAGALASADQIRKTYMDQMSQLKDKKTRTIALKDVARIDSKIALLRSAVDSQISRKERLDLMVPTFAAGGSLGGYVTGPGHATSDNMLGYFPAADRMAAYSPTEYILDAETTRNIGIGNLDVMRASKGASFNEMRKVAPVRRAMGGPTASPMSFVDVTRPASTNGNTTLELSLNVGIAEEAFAEVVSAAIRQNDGSREQINVIVNALKNMGATNPLAQTLAQQLLGHRS